MRVIQFDVFAAIENDAAYLNSTALLFAIFQVYLVLIWFPALLDIGDTGVGLGIAPVAIGLLLLLPVGRIKSVRFTHEAHRTVLVFMACLAALSLLSYFSFFHAENKFRVGRPLLTYLQGFYVFAVIYAVMDRIRERRILNMLSVLAVLLSCAAASSYFVPQLGEIFFHGRDRTAAFFKNPNQFGIVLSCVAPIHLARGLLVRHWRFLNLTGYAIIGFALIASGSKTNLILYSASGIGLMVVSAMMSGSFAKSAGLLFRNLLLIAVLALPAFTVLQSFNPRAAGTLAHFATAQEAVTVSQRFILWKHGIDTGMQNPWLGEGAGQLTVHPLTHEVYTHSHNLFVDYFRTLGLPGLIVIAFLVFSVLALVVRMYFRLQVDRVLPRERRATILGLMASVVTFFLSNQLSDSFGPSTTPFFWVVLVLLIYNAQILLDSSNSGTRSWVKK